MCSQSFLRGCIVLCAVLYFTVSGGAQTACAGPKTEGGSLQVADEVDAMGFDAIKAKSLGDIGGDDGSPKSI